MMAANPHVLALHIIGLIMWAGGLAAAVYFMRSPVAERHTGSGPTLEGLFHAIINPGVVLLLATGIFLLFLSPGVMTERWFQAKLLVVLAAIALHVRIFRLAAARSAGHPPPSVRAVALLYAGLTSSVLAALLLTFAKPW